MLLVSAWARGTLRLHSVTRLFFGQIRVPGTDAEQQQAVCNAVEVTIGRMKEGLPWEG